MTAIASIPMDGSAVPADAPISVSRRPVGAVPARTRDGRRWTPARIAEALADAGYRRIGDAVEYSRGHLHVQVQPIGDPP